LWRCSKTYAAPILPWRSQRFRLTIRQGLTCCAPSVAGAYFLNPEVRQAVGYPGQQAAPIVPEDPPDYEQDGLLASVIARGLIYRPTP